MILSVIKKEAKELLQDKGFLALAIIEPIIFILIIGSTFQNSPENISTVIVDHDNSVFSHYAILGIDESDVYNVLEVVNTSLEEQINRVNRSEIRAVIYIPRNFTEEINNSETATIETYFDSSEFIIYAFLSGAQGEIIKNSLKNITSDIVNDIESERDYNKLKIDEIKTLFDTIESQISSLENNFNESEKSKEDYTLKVNETINNIREKLNTQLNFFNETENSISTIILSLQSLNTSNNAQRDSIISGLQGIRASLSSIGDGLTDSISKLNDASLSGNFSSKTNIIRDKLNLMKGQFYNAEALSRDVNIDLSRLRSAFLAEPILINERAVHGKITYFDSLAPGILSFIIFFIALTAPTINVIKEKENNTLYRLSTTPSSGTVIFTGKFMIFLVFGFIEIIYTLLLAIIIYDVRISGSFFDTIAILFLVACSAISLGLFISSKIKTIQQGLLAIPMIIVPFFLVSRTFFPGDFLPVYMKYVSYLSPLTFSTHALREIMLKGTALVNVLGDIAVLLLYIFIPLILFIISYRRIKY